MVSRRLRTPDPARRGCPWPRMRQALPRPAARLSLDACVLVDISVDLQAAVPADAEAVLLLALNERAAGLVVRPGLRTGCAVVRGSAALFDSSLRLAAQNSPAAARSAVSVLVRSMEPLLRQALDRGGTYDADRGRGQRQRAAAPAVAAALRALRLRLVGRALARTAPFGGRKPRVTLRRHFDAGRGACGAALAAQPRAHPPACGCNGRRPADALDWPSIDAAVVRQPIRRDDAAWPRAFDEQLCLRGRRCEPTGP